MDVLVCCRAFVVLSLSRCFRCCLVCVWPFTAEILYFATSLMQACRRSAIVYCCLLLFSSPPTLSFLFVLKFSFVSVLEQPSLEVFFVSFWSGVGKEPQEFCVVAREEQQQQGEQERGERGEQCTLSFLCLLRVRSCCCSGANLLRMMSLEASR